MSRRPTECASAADEIDRNHTRAEAALLKSHDLVREALGCMGGLGGCTDKWLVSAQPDHLASDARSRAGK